MPGDWSYRATARAGDWLDVLGMLAALRGRDGADGDPADPPRVLIALSPPDNSLALRGGGMPDGRRRTGWEASASFAAEFAAGAESIALAANPLYVEQAIRALHLPDDGEVEFAAISDGSPFLLRASGDAATFIVVMPMARHWPPAAASG